MNFVPEPGNEAVGFDELAAAVDDAAPEQVIISETEDGLTIYDPSGQLSQNAIVGMITRAGWQMQADEFYPYPDTEDEDD